MNTLGPVNFTNVNVLKKMPTETNFPYNIYDADIVRETPYYKRDIRNIDNKVFLANPKQMKEGVNPNIPQTWGWNHFPNGYGYGNFQGHYNCYDESNRMPRGYTKDDKFQFIKRN
jgi:hypothetical protein